MYENIYTYFVAPGEEQAAAVVDWPQGPDRPEEASTEEPAGARSYPSALAALDPAMELLGIAAGLEGAPQASLDLAWQVAQTQDTLTMVTGIDDAVAAALSQAGPDQLREAFTAWYEQEYWEPDEDETQAPLEDLGQIAALARKAVQTGSHLYTWITF